jgi:phage terminase large subunit
LSQQAQEELTIAVNDCYIPLYENQSRFLILPGGAGSGKSLFVADKIVHRTLCEENHKFLCLRKVGDTVEDSIFAELSAAIETRQAMHEFRINKTKHSFYHIPTKNWILCMGLDDSAKIKSIKGITGMWLEEATEFEEDDFDQLNLRIRGLKSNYVQYILSFNPIDENHWLKKRFIDKKDSDATVKVTTHRDNHFLTSADRQQLLNLAGRNQLYYDVYVEARWGVVVKHNKFAYNYSKDVHEIDSYEPNPHLPILISFDFNVNPMTSLISQRINDLHTITFDELEVPGSGSTEEMCELIREKYMHWMLSMDITGDATGHNREKARRGNISSYMVIKEMLELRDYNLLMPSKNPDLKDSREIVNAVLRHGQWRITKNCEKTIEDIIYAPIKNKPNGHIEIVKTEDKGYHFCDNFRYTLHCFYRDFIKNPKKYRQ